MSYEATYVQKRTTVGACLDLIHSNDVVFVAGDGNAPLTLANSLHEIAPRVEHVKVFKDFTNYFPFPHLDGMQGHIFSQGFFFGRDLREGLPKGNSSYFPTDICNNGRFIAMNHPTVYIAAATPMDERGTLQIGLCQMGEPEALEAVRACGGRILLEVNRNIPRVRGGLEVSIDEVAALIESDRPLTQIPPTTASPEEEIVARNVRSLMHDGDCVQFGIGALPNAIADLCMDLNDLGMHTEMLTTAMGRMVREGVITSKRKNFNRGEHIFTFVGGNQELFDTLAGNDQFRAVPASYGCDPFVIAQNDNMVSINTCIEMDLMGQIASEAIGTKQFSGSGGALDYAYGAMRAKGGRGIMAFTSRTAKGQSKIRCLLGEGSTVTIPRNYADYIVTEYGVAQLRGKNLRERAEALIELAHPDFRPDLRRDAQKLMWL